MADTRNAYKIVVRKFVEKEPLGTSGCGWEDKIIISVI
jgi:hypothetical protein